MGIVYEALHLDLGRKVALKVLRNELRTNRRARAQLVREARTASALEHPGSVRIYDFGECDGKIFVAMELLQGPTLRERLEAVDGALELPLALSIGADLASVLASAHDIGLVHRDIKPENVFLVPLYDGGHRTVLADFGLALIPSQQTTGRVTQEGVVIGTPAYVSPEQANGQTPTCASDLYSLGCMLFELCCGTPPFSGPALQLVMRHALEVPESMSARRPDLGFPRALVELVQRLLSKEPERRPSAAYVREALLEIALASLEDNTRSSSRLDFRRRRGLANGRAAQPAHAGEQEQANRWGVLAVIGGLADEHRGALLAGGWRVVDVAAGAPIPPEATVALARCAPAEEVRRLAGSGLPVVASAGPDIEDIAAMIRAGASAAVLEPASVEDITRQLARVARRSAQAIELANP
jgi:serine/threonine protein kinase